MSGFSQSLCGCFDDLSLCCDTICCPCYQVGHQYAAIQGRPHSNSGCECMCSNFLPILLPMYASCIRCKTSNKYNLGESCCLSTVIGCCVPMCSLCQTGRELNYRGTNPGGCMCTPDDMAGGMPNNGGGGGGATNIVVNVAAPASPPPMYPPQHTYPPPQGYPPQGYPPQGYPPQGHPQGYPPQGQRPY